MRYFQSVCYCLPGFILSVVFCFSGSAIAEEYSGDNSKNSLAVLEPVTVVGTAEDHITGKNTLTEAQIKILPQGNGSINELLTVLPSVQTSDLATTSNQAGEITPPNISISGGRFYDNNFIIDGIGDNNLLDPAFSSSLSIFDVPGHPQEVFLSSRLVGRLDVYRYNVSAKFGDFTGGVVEARTKDPAEVFSGNIFYRTTRDQWTEFHIDDAKQDDFEQSHDASSQPRFDKHLAGFEVNAPVSSDMRFLAAYNQTYSIIPLNHLGAEKTQYRRGENYLLKGVWDLSSTGRLSMTAIHAPYEEDRFKSQTVNSDFSLFEETTSVSSTYEHFFAMGKFQLEAGYKTSENSREAPANHYSWDNTGINDWGVDRTGSKSFEGGYGDIEKTQDSFEWSISSEFTPVRTGLVTHGINVGFEYNLFQGSFDRKETTYIFSKSELSGDVDCTNDPIGCIDNNEFFYQRFAYDAKDSTARMATYGAYLEDNLQFWHLTFRPGVRFSYDDFLHNDNWAPRLAATWDIFGNGDTLLVGGWNRYYGKTLLTYKLREAILKGRLESRSQTLSADNQPEPWPDPTQAPRSYRYSNLATPYSDEAVVGVDQALMGGRLNLTYVRRDGEDEFAQETGEPDLDGNKPLVLNNNGSSRHEEYSAAWERNFGKHYVSINIVYQETNTSNESYDDKFDDLVDIERICLDADDNNKVISCSELTRRDYNRPWVANLTYSVKLPYNFSFTNFTKYRSGYVGLVANGFSTAEKTAANFPTEFTVTSYREEKQPESWIFDWKLDWRQNLFRSQGIQLSLEVYNVFNQKVPAGAETDVQTYEIGRQFWAGMEYYF